MHETIKKLDSARKQFFEELKSHGDILQGSPSAQNAARNTSDNLDTAYLWIMQLSSFIEQGGTLSEEDINEVT